MKKLFVLSLVLAIVLAVGWEVLSYYEPHYIGLVLYGHLIDMKTLKEASLANQRLITQPENQLVVMHFEGKPNAIREPDFYTAKLIDKTGAFHKLQTALWDKPDENYLVFAVPEKTEIAGFQFSDQASFPISYFDKFAWLRFRNWVGIATLTMIALAIVLGIFKHFIAEEKVEEHVDPFDFINKNKAA
jgi:hypothetical protein